MPTLQQDHRKPVFKAMDYISQTLHLNPTLAEIANSVALSRALPKPMPSIEKLRDAKVVWTMFEGKRIYQAQ
ncbi:hypothetical protein AB4K05_10000 [Kluyvera sp. STS39-E]|uniref:hypothetical protein n=1 Tax=Kluyvera sp. STS39-E TaxID=3234748 RepID=UPI0034C64E9D